MVKIAKLITAAGMILVAQTLHAGPVSFNRDVRPILSSKCLHCHGPSEKSRKAKLRLDDEASATGVREGIQAIKPGDLKGSELWHRINSRDPDEQMPPPESKKEITAKEIAILRSMGSSGRGVQKIFLLLGGIVGLIGSLSGLIVGLSTCGAIGFFGIPLPRQYYIELLPVHVIPIRLSRFTP